MSIETHKTGESPRYLEDRGSRWTHYEGRMLIGGELVSARSGRTMPIVDPSTEQELGTVPLGDAHDAEDAVSAASAAFPAWRDRPLRDRVGYLREVADLVRRNKEEFAALDARDCGNPYQAMLGDVTLAIEAIEFFAGVAAEVKGSTYEHGPASLMFTEHQPYGVAARILPFNHPFQFVASKIAAPLVCGNTVIMKPAEHTSLSAMRFGEIVQSVLPPGVVNIVTGLGAEVGDALVRHPQVPRIAFTGSSATGKRVLAGAVEGIKPVTLELGGKNPMIVFADVDVDQAVSAAVASMNFSRCQGQSCQSTSRLFLHDSIADVFVDRLAQAVGQLRVGSPMHDGTDMGPLAYARHYEHVTGYIAKGLDEGARLLTGGGRPAGMGTNGYFVEPTVFVDVEPSMTIAREEIFGPVLSVFRWSDPAEVVQLANSADYALTANIWTKSLHSALDMARAIDAGYLWVNGVGKRGSGMPFGGYKNSGMGKEGSIEEIYSYTKQKTVNITF